jgi:hypothetical protein
VFVLQHSVVEMCARLSGKQASKQLQTITSMAQPWDLTSSDVLDKVIPAGRKYSIKGLLYMTDSIIAHDATAPMRSYAPPHHCYCPKYDISLQAARTVSTACCTRTTPPSWPGT